MLYPPVSPLPSAYRADRRRTRAADTDEGGRRAGNPEDGNLDNKEILPAYDNVGGPPKYVEMNMGAGTPVHLALAGVVERLPINDTPGHEQDTPMQSAEEVASSSHSFRTFRLEPTTARTSRCRCSGRPTSLLSFTHTLHASELIGYRGHIIDRYLASFGAVVLYVSVSVVFLPTAFVFIRHMIPSPVLSLFGCTLNDLFCLFPCHFVKWIFDN